MQSIYTREDVLREQDLNNYYVFHQAFTPEEIETIICLGDMVAEQDGKVVNDVDSTYRRSRIRWLPRDSTTEFLYARISTLVKRANEACWHFDLIGFGEQIQLSVYEAGDKGFYDWHMDCGETSNYRKISVSIQLSSPSAYDGGKLQFFTSRCVRNAPNRQGDMILFPSYLMHRITPVTRGQRQSLVVWITGHPFR